MTTTTPRTVTVRLVHGVTRRHYRLEYAAASDHLTRAERGELAAWRAVAGVSRRTVRQLLAFVFVGAALVASVLAGPDADAAATADTGDTRTGARAWAVSLPLSPWLPVCEHEDSSDCIGDGGDWTAVRVAPGAVCVTFRPGHGAADYCTADAYPPAGAPTWAQLTRGEARAVVLEVGGDVDAWAGCAVTVAGAPAIVCPGGAWHPRGYVLEAPGATA